MNKIRYSPESKKDLDKICDYIRDDLKNISTAKNTANGIISSINKLKEFPQLGPVWYLDNNDDSGFRFLRYKNYLIFYMIVEKNVYITRIFHQRQDFINKLFK